MTERWKPEDGERYYFIGADGKPGRGDYSVDGHVCGVFEHLEEGDWIE
jgi:hypothetical protein